MRPRRIEMEGFGTFVAPTAVDFDDVDLVAFVGPTGSGKSTVIDAMTFALYGSVARYDDARLVAPVISQTANEARVRLDFESAGVAHTAVRVVRRTKTGASTKEARLERTAAGDAEAEVIASGAKEVTEAVEALLGLDFTQFTRTVVLPQGEFAKFLKDDPGNRQKLLSRLLDLGLYARMGSAARARSAEAATQADVFAKEAAAMGEATADAVTAARARFDAVTTFGDGLADHLAGIDELEAELTEMRRTRAELDAAVTALGRIVRPDGIDGLAQRIADARAAADDAEERLADARAARDAAQDAVAEAGEVAAHRARLDQLARLEALGAEVEATAATVDQLAEPVAAAQVAVAEATEAAAVAMADLERARAHADAAQWTAQLVVGDPCPVCHQSVTALPDHDADAALASAASASAAAKASLDGATATLGERSREAQVASSLLDKRRAELAELTAAIPAGIDKEQVTVQLAAAADAAEQGKVAAAAMRDAEAAVAGARRTVEAAAADDAEARRHLSAARDSVASLGPPAIEGESLVVDWDTLVDWAAATGAERTEALAALTVDGKAVRARQDEQWAAVAELARPLGFALDDLKADARGLVATARAQAEAAVQATEQRLAQRTDLDAKQAEAQRRHEIHRSLGQLLKADGFERWLLSEAVADLVERATGRLYELSGGQFSLTNTETSFEIVDHRNADATRDVRTLSGGETFLASLALALALADSIADLAPVDTPRLESMFLDEGFGTLDPETLDLVAGAIEELSASGRLVGIVTHIDALAERMPVRFVVRKEPATSVIERVSQ